MKVDCESILASARCTGVDLKDSANKVTKYNELHPNTIANYHIENIEKCDI
jgi:hypothetical protein